MKKNIFYLMCGLLGFTMLFTACSSEDPILPEFPSEIVSGTLAPNGTKTFTINPNMDWSIELSNKTDFYIKDGNNDVYTMHGTAGEQTITLCARNIVEFDNDLTCDVIMKMGNETKTIAKFSLLKSTREMSIYAAQVEDGAYVGEEDENGNFIYTYGASPIQSISMVYSFEAGYTSAVKVNANFDWIVETPEWLQPVEGGDANTDVELVFQINTEAYPANGTVGEIKFLDANNESKVGGTMAIAFDYAANTIAATWIEEPAYISEVAASGWPFNESAISDYDFLSTYDVYYASQWDSETSYRISKPVKSFKAYSYAASGNFEDITGEESWLAGSSAEGLPFMYITMDDSKSTAAAAKNEVTGELEGVLVVEFEDGSFSAIYCHYKTKAQGGSTGDIKIVSDYADMLGVSLVEVVEGDEDFVYDYVEMGVPQYRLTYTMPGGVAALSLPEGMVYPLAEWITVEGENSYMWIYMNPDESMELPAKGVIQVFNTSWEVAAVINCVYAPEF